jgi:hypothetical protein
MDLGWAAAVTAVAARLVRPGPGTVRDAAEAAAAPEVEEADPPPPWAWTAYQLAQLLVQYPAGVTPAMAAAELERLWLERGVHAAAADERQARGTDLDTFVREGTLRDEAYLDVVVTHVRTLGDGGGDGPPVLVGVLTAPQGERSVEAYLHRQVGATVAEALHGAPHGGTCRVRLAGCRLGDRPGVTAVTSKARMLPMPLAIFVADSHLPLPPWLAARFADAAPTLAAGRAAVEQGGAVLAVWGMVAAVDATEAVAVPGQSQRRRVRAVWLRPAPYHNHNHDSKVEDDDISPQERTCMLLLWDDYVLLGAALHTVRGHYREEVAGAWF